MPLNASSPTSLSQNFRYPPSVRRNTGLLRCAVLLSMLLVLGFCTAMLLLHSFSDGTRGSGCEGCIRKDIPENARIARDQCRDICTTVACMKTASEVINRMDTVADPCNDFHRFSCGKYDKISMGKVKRQQFMNDAAEEIIPVLSGLIQNIPKNIPRGIPGYSASKARNLYDSCVSFYPSEEMAVPTILKYIEFFGIKNWPHLNSNYEFANPDLDEAIARLSLYEANPFFGYEIQDNSRNSLETNITESNDSDYGLDIKVRSQVSTLFSSPNLDVRGNRIMNHILDDFGMPYDLINATAEELFAFEDALDDIQKRSRKRIRKCTFNTTISCAAYQFYCSEERSEEMDRWCTIAIKVLNETGIRVKHPSLNVIFEDKFYFKDITALIQRTGHRTIAHAMALQLFLKHLIVMSYPFRRTSSTSGLLKELLEKFQDERKFLCVTLTVIHLPALVGRIFYSTIYSGRVQEEADEIYTDIREHLVAHVRKMKWMDRNAQESLEEQLWRIRLSLKGYLPYVTDASEIDEYFERLEITDKSFLSNMMEIRKFRYISQILYHDNITLVLFRESPKFQFNPNYQEDVIVMDFASFIYPLISKDRPRYINLGFFGSFLAHEFSHAVEIFLRDRENMSSTFETSLNEKKKCLIDQYSEYEIDLINTKINGSFTLHENMADFFSIRPTYQALKSYQEKHGTQRALPGLPFTEDQLFFISYAQWWCENNTPETMKQYLEDSHSPGKYRVFGMLKNFAPFATAFNCPLGSPMNPIEKCDF